MKKTKIFKNIALFLLFNIVLAFSIERVAYVLREKEGTNTWDNHIYLHVLFVPGL